jgi:hypothetical protein
MVTAADEEDRMSLKPIDLQNLFVRLNQVSKDQAAQQQSQLHAQQVAGQEIEEKTLKNDNKVNKTDEMEQGPEQVTDEKQKGQSKAEQKKKEEEEKAASESADSDGKPKKNPFEDPDLGNTIDIMG